DLWRSGKTPAPVRIWRERKRIRWRWNIHMGTRVGVVPPGATQSRLLLQNHEVVLAGALQLDRHADARHARAHDDNLVLAVLRRLSWRQRFQGDAALRLILVVACP